MEVFKEIEWLDGRNIKRPKGNKMGKNQRRVGMMRWDDMLPDNAFCDDPRADAYDKHGEVRRVGGFIPVSRGYEVT